MDEIQVPWIVPIAAHDIYGPGQEGETQHRIAKLPKIQVTYENMFCYKKHESYHIVRSLDLNIDLRHH